ncbi:MAG: hypothetical protein H6821_16980 [Planctomycetaceae bacterium]|nr:hypothetical protein [Planctomycetales bacterium]MCB9875865.1 hypothetical protein [Planctomycetaceae bacterium]
MPSTTTRFVIFCLIVASSFFMAVVTEAADLAPRANGQVSSLPLALHAAGIDRSQILDEKQADAVRGEWILDLRLGLGQLYFQGAGRTTVEVHTLSAGAWHGKPTSVQLTIGR